MHFSSTFTWATLLFFHLPGFAEMHKAKVYSNLFITKLHLVCRHLAPFLAATVEKLAHADRQVGTLLCFLEVISQGKV